MIEETLRQHIARAKESLNAIAKAAGIDYGSLYRFVHENRNIQVDSVQKLCHYFGLELKYADSKIVEVLGKAVELLVKKSRIDFKHRNGKLKREALREFVISHERLPAHGLSENERDIAAFYDGLAGNHKARLLDKALDSLSIRAALNAIDIKALSDLDRKLQEFREAYQQLDDEQKKLLRRRLVGAEEFQREEYKLLGWHSFTIAITVGHSYHDEDGRRCQANGVTLTPILMRKAIDAWRAGKEFTPKGFLEQFT